MASLSVEDLGQGRFKIRWRELVAGPDGAPIRGADGRLMRRARSVTVEGKDARDEAVSNIRRALVQTSSGATHQGALDAVPAGRILAEVEGAGWVFRDAIPREGSG